MHLRFCSSLVALLAAGCIRLQASILGQNDLEIDFTNAGEAGEKASWSPVDAVAISAAGLGWDGEAAASRDGWIQTKPLAVGLSWRPAASVNLRVEVTPAPKPITLANGQTTTPWAGEAFARYSPDGVHWSTWQALVRDSKKTEVRAFSGEITVPQRERREYGEFLAEYSKLDVPWRSDEEAATAWILKRSPDFFGRCLPFIGYVELLVEFPFQGSQRITKLQASASYGMSGMHYPPKDEKVFNERQNSPWRFKPQ